MLTGSEYALLVESVKAAEGFRATAYQDSVGVWTVGFGTNLQELSIDRPTAERWLNEALRRCETEAARFPWYATLNPPRQRVILEMLYNLGLTRFVGFLKMLAAIERKDYAQAAEQMMSSKWASQVGVRATKLAAIMRGPYPEDLP